MLIFQACCCSVHKNYHLLFQEHQREHEREPAGAGDPGQPQQDGGLQVPRPQPRPRPGQPASPGRGDAEWQGVSGTRHKFFVYSAYCDDREKPLVRVIAATKTKKPDKVIQV